MAIKTFTALKDMRHPRYNTRMLKAGDPVELDAPQARLYTALGAIGPRDADGSGKVIQPSHPPAAKPAKGAVPAMTTQNTGKRKRAPRKASSKK